MRIVVIDGVRYEAWTPQNEYDFEKVVKEHAKDIFGEQSIYLDIKHKLRTKSGIGSIPDGYVIIFGDEPHWHIVEVELSSHPLYEHIVPQVSRFINGIKNPSTQKDIVSAIYQEIDSDEFVRLRLKKAIGTTETYKFLSDLLSKSPVVTIIIEKRTEQLDEAIGALAHSQIKIVEFQTFIRAGVGLDVHAHLFGPLYEDKKEEKREIGWQGEGYTLVDIVGDYEIYEKKGEYSIGKLPQRAEIARGLRSLEQAKSWIRGDKLPTIEITVRNPSFIKFHLFVIPKSERSFFPGYKVPFKLETDVGEIETYVTSDKEGTQIGDPHGGTYIQAKLAGWYRQHPTVKVGDKVVFEVIEPMKRYRLKTE